MINDLKHLFNIREPLPWDTVIKLFLVGCLFLYMSERDHAIMEESRELAADNQALVETVTAMQEVIDNTQCSAGFEMTVPVNVGS